MGYGDISGNLLVDSPFQYSSDTYQLGACSLTIPYTYAGVLNSAADVPAVVLAGAGIGKLGSVTSNKKPLEGQFDVFPNPFKGAATFALNLTSPSRVGITLYTAEGRKVADIATPAQVLGTGQHRIAYQNAALTAGLYFYVVTTDHGTFSQKLVVQ